MLAFDTETFPFGNGRQAPQVVCLSESGDDHTSLHRRADILAVSRFAPCLKSLQPLCGHNVAYDFACLVASLPSLMAPTWAAYSAGTVQCTQVRARLLDIFKGDRAREKGRYTLGSCCKRAGLDQGKDEDPGGWRLRYGDLDDYQTADYPAAARKYARQDAAATLALYEAQRLEAIALGYKGFEREAARQTSYAFPLQLMRVWGVRCDAGQVEALARKTAARLRELDALLRVSGLVRANGTKDLSLVRERIENALGDSAPTTKTGKVSTSASTIERCDDSDLQRLVEHTQLQKLESTYIDKLWEGVGGNLHASTHVLGADTGRTSSSGPNLQNQPRSAGIRECFVPREGCVFISIDYDAQELRTLAQACLDLVGHSKLAQAFQCDPGFDPHLAFACSLMRWDYDTLHARNRLSAEEKTRRQQAKAANFGFPGGLGAAAFQSYARGYGVVLDQAEALALKAQWFDQWPEMREYFEHVQVVAQGTGRAMLPRSGRWRGGVSFCDTANYYFQGPASDASKTAAFECSKRCYNEPGSALYGARPWALIHDELLLEAPEQRAAAAAAELEVIMVDAMALWCPDVPARASAALSRYWSKDAEPVYHNGTLVPWEVET